MKELPYIILIRGYLRQEILKELPYIILIRGYLQQEILKELPYTILIRGYLHVARDSEGAHLYNIGTVMGYLQQEML